MVIETEESVRIDGYQHSPCVRLPRRFRFEGRRKSQKETNREKKGKERKKQDTHTYTFTDQADKEEKDPKRELTSSGAYTKTYTHVRTTYVDAWMEVESAEAIRTYTEVSCI